MLRHDRRALRLLVLVVLGAAPWLAPAYSQVGSWSPVIDWEYYIASRDYVEDPTGQTLACPATSPPFSNSEGVIGEGNNDSEISHAALMSTGSYAGWVLFWRKEGNPNSPSGNCNCTLNNSVLWAVNPATPAEPIAIYFQFQSDVFCAGQSWDNNGQLLIAVTFPGFFGHPRTRGTREDVRHAEESPTNVHS